MNRIDRLFGISVLLQTGKYCTAESISEKFDISVRTVYRDLKALTELGIPIGFEPQKGYHILQGYFLAPVAFNTEEAQALLLMENFISGFADQSIKKHYSSALAKVKAVLKHSQKEQLNTLQESMGFQIPERLYNHSEYLSLIQEAIAQKQMLRLEYCNANEEQSTRDVEPTGLIFYAFSWHLIGWCHLRQQYRDFKLTRIVKLRNMHVPFSIKEHLALAEYMKQLPVNY